MRGEHHYEVTVQWTGNTGSGTANHQSYSQDHDVIVQGKPTLQGSADPRFRGRADRWNPEELLVAALAECHMLTYLTLCATHGVTVTSYEDMATGRMETLLGGSGRFVEVVLNPKVAVTAESSMDQAVELHLEANKSCFIANSVNFPVHHNPVVETV